MKFHNKRPKEFVHYLMVDGFFSPRTQPNTTTKIDPGIYTLAEDRQGNIYFGPQESMTDNLINLPEQASVTVLNELTTFWKAETRDKFERFGLLYKRGIILHGKPGTGKTSIIARAMDEVTAMGGITIFNPEPRLLSRAIGQARQIQPDIKVLVVFEEFDGICNTSGFLSLLDGELGVDNIAYIATTNHIDKIPDRVKNRPSRFARVIEIGLPSEESKRVYLETKLKGTGQDIDAWLAHTKDFVIDQVKDLVVSVMCFDYPISEASEKIRSMGYEEKDLTPEIDPNDRRSRIGLLNHLTDLNEKIAFGIDAVQVEG